MSMRTGRSTWLRLLVVGAGVVGAIKVGGWVLGDATHGPSLVNRVWIDHMPRDGRDLVGHLVVAEQDGKRFGVAGRASRWRGLFDGFIWGLDRDLLRTRFPQEERKAQFRVRTWTCKGEAPRPFELCLELAHGQRKIRLYSMKDWVVRPHDEALPEAIADLGGALHQARAEAARAGAEPLDAPGATAAPDDWSPLD